MFKVEKVDESNKKCVIDFLKSDIIRHVFAFYDIQHEPEHTTLYGAFENEDLRGYILTYKALEFPSVVLECESDVAAKLIKLAPENRFIMHAPLNLLPVIKERFPNSKHYVEHWMLVRKGQANYFQSKFVHKLRSKDDASKLATLLSTLQNRPRGIAERYVDWIGKMPVYGVFINDELVSYAGSFLQLPEIWMIGGVYTNPNRRNKDYAAIATSAVTKDALKKAETAALFVRSDNYPAIRVYDKIGYRKVGGKLWVDVGTGLRP